MGEALRQRLRQSRFQSPSHEAMLNLLVAASHVREQMERASEAHGITPAQYNVLRILRGVHPEGYPRCEVARRLVERSPDLTRLIDRLVRRGLVERTRSSADRRLSVTRITRKGLELLETMQPALDGVHRMLGDRLSRRECQTLSELLERVYGSKVTANGNGRRGRSNGAAERV